jgi:hypothetical protein
MKPMLRLIIVFQEKQIYCGRPSWQLSYYVESSLIKKLLKSLMDKESKHILVHGPYGSGTTTLVEYVLQTYANVLRDHFFGGIFKLECGPDDYENIRLIASQKDLLQQLAPGDHEVWWPSFLLQWKTMSLVVDCYKRH